MKEDIIIKRDKHGFDVWMGDKHIDRLTYDELLAVIASICSSERIRMVHYGWFMTDEERESHRVMIHDLANTQFTDHDATNEPTDD